jgi:hypothetical protein
LHNICVGWHKIWQLLQCEELYNANIKAGASSCATILFLEVYMNELLVEAIKAGLIYEIKTSLIRSGLKQKRARLAGRETIFMARKTNDANYKRYLFYRQQLNAVKQRMKRKLGNRATIQAKRVLR